MKKLALLLVLVPTLAWATDPNTINPLPGTTPNAQSYAAIRTFLANEDADRFDEMFTSFVVSGGTHGTAAGLTATPASMTAYAGGYRITEPGTTSITYGANQTTWVIAQKDTTGNVTVFTRVPGSHFLTYENATQPVLPADSVYLMKVVTDGTGITAVTDLRTREPVVPGNGGNGNDTKFYPAGTTEADVQTAIDDAVAAGGGIVVLACNQSYSISTGLTVTDPSVQIVGCGRSTKLILAAASISAVTFGADCGACGGGCACTANAGNAIKDVMIDFNSKDSTGVEWTRWGQIGLNENVWFINPAASSIGIETTNSTGGANGDSDSVNEIIVKGLNWWNLSTEEGGTNRGTAVKIDTNNTKVIESTIIGAQVGVEIGLESSIGKAVIANNRISRNEIGIRLGGAGQGMFSLGVVSNRLENNRLYGIQIQGFDSTSNAAQGVYIADNMLRANSLASKGIYLRNTKGAVLIANVFKDFTTSAGGIPIMDGGGNTEFSSMAQVKAQGTDINSIVPSTLSQKTVRLGGTVHCGNSAEADAPTTTGVAMYCSNDGTTAYVARDSTNNIEAFMTAGQEGPVGSVRYLAKFGSPTYGVSFYPTGVERGGFTSQGAFWLNTPAIISGATPDISQGNLFVTGNGAPTTMTAFANCIAGQEIVLVAGDANTTIDFTANASLTGNGGSDLSMSDGQMIHCMCDSASHAYCLVPGAGGGGGNAFGIIATPAGTSPNADAAPDTLTFTSANCTITGDSATDTIDFDCPGAVTVTGTPVQHEMSMWNSATQLIRTQCTGSDSPDAGTTDDQINCPAGFSTGDANDWDRPNYIQLMGNDINLTTNPTCANYGVAGRVTLIDTSESGTPVWELCIGTSQAGQLFGRHTIPFDAGAMSTDGDGATGCSTPAEVTFNSAHKLFVTTCHDNNAGTLWGHVRLPKSYSGSTIFPRWQGYSEINQAGDVNFMFTCVCASDGDTLDPMTYAGSQEVGITFSTAWRYEEGASGGGMACANSCASGDSMFWKAVIVAADTTNALDMTKIHVIGASFTYGTDKVSDD